MGGSTSEIVGCQDVGWVQFSARHTGMLHGIRLGFERAAGVR